MKNKLYFYVFGMLAFLLPCILYLSNASASLGFADAGEFALVTKILSIAHPPGFPSYVFIGWLWGALAGIFSTNHVLNMVLFSILCSSFAGLLLYGTIMRIFAGYPQIPERWKQISALSAVVGFATGVTVWYWSHAVEVYAFQILAFALTVYGLVSYQREKHVKHLIVAATGIGLGLANHHLTMILFLPFAFFFLWKPALNPRPVLKMKKGKTGSVRVPFFQTKHFYWLAGISALLTILFYTAMMFRAAANLPFKFGSPDTLSRLFYHLSGGAWMTHTKEQVEGVFALRLPYFLQLTWEQFMGVTVLMLAGLVFAFRNKLGFLLLSTIGYFCLVLFYQLRMNQFADTDAYLLLPFYAMYLLVPFGVVQLQKISKHLLYLLPALVLVSPLMNFAKTDSRDYAVSKTIMHSLDYSAPKNSIIIIADWTTVSQYYYYRICENFRPDLIVLNYDLKFTNKDILPTMYPEFYKQIKPEYDRLIELLFLYHPQEAYNTGCTLDNADLNNAFRTLSKKIQNYAQQQHVTYLVDPKTFVNSFAAKLMTSKITMSGMFISNSTTSTGLGKEFLQLDYPWLKSERLLRDPAATDKVVDLEAMLDIYKRYYKASGDEADFRQAEASYQRIKQIQKVMKQHMNFLFIQRQN